jgi:hypothetical protein
VARPPFSTIPERRVPAIVLIGGGAALLEACRDVMRYVEAAVLEQADLAEATTVIARVRPFVILVDEDVLAFDPAEFEALARDVGSALIAVPDVFTHDEQVSFLLPRIKAALREWDEREVFPD